MGVEDRNDVPITTGSTWSTAPGVGVPSVSPTHDVTWKAQPHRGSLLRNCLQAIILRDDGYLRIIPGDGGKAAYCKYKWTGGPWGGYYVMTVGLVQDIEELLDMLEGKIAEVDAGVRRPTKDTPHGQ